MGSADAGPSNPDPAGFGVYVHWPFCAAKCPYCDFNSHVRHGGVDQTAYSEALVTELKTTAATVGQRRVDSIFFGGGTPSLMSSATVGSVLDAISNVWTIAEDAEITLEANPTSVEADRFEGYHTAGINRVSLGVQALNDRDLKALGRLHSVAEALAALDVANRKFERVSFDLIYARTGQTAAQWEAELTDALALGSGHLSLYQLTIEPETPFAALHAAGKLSIPRPEAADEMFVLTRDLSEAAGLPLYEISNHARHGEESRHNLIYWRYGEYVGIGPGAHGRPIIAGTRHATETIRHPETWLAAVGENGHGRTSQMALSHNELADEFLLMGLRLAEGIDPARLLELSGLELSASALDALTNDGLVEAAAANRIKATDKGRFVLDQIVLALSDSLEEHR